MISDLEKDTWRSFFEFVRHRYTVAQLLTHAKMIGRAARQLGWPGN